MRVVNSSVGIWCKEGLVRSSNGSRWKSCKCRDGEITTPSSRVPSDTINLTTPEVATRFELGLLSWMQLRQWRSRWLVFWGGGGGGGGRGGSMTGEIGCGSNHHGC